MNLKDKLAEQKENSPFAALSRQEQITRTVAIVIVFVSVFIFFIKLLFL